MIRADKTELDGVLLLTPPTLFADLRGTHVELYNARVYEEAGVAGPFIQDNIATSQHNVLRGIHGDNETWKLVSCLYGRFFFVVVNWDSTSPQYKRWQTFELSDQNRQQVLVPPRFGNGHLVLSETAIFHYKQTTYYNRAAQFTIAWNNPELAVPWPCKNPVLSDRDKLA